jgi:hypothetical protein
MHNSGNQIAEWRDDIWPQSSDNPQNYSGKDYA